MNEELKQELVENHTVESGVLFPAYENYSFANVQDTILSIFDQSPESPLPDSVFGNVGNDFENVVVILVDGFGLHHWNTYNHPVFQRFEELGQVTPLTSIYPSETAAALTGFHTASQPCEHGVIGWNVYEPEWDATFRAFGGEVKSGNELTDEQRGDISAVPPVYPKLQNRGIDCRHIVPRDTTFDGAELYSYKQGGLSEGERMFVNSCKQSSDPSYTFWYLPQLDAIAHEYGSNSLKYEQNVYFTFDVIHHALQQIDCPNTIAILTADHGHFDVDGSIDLEEYQQVMSELKRHNSGEIVRYSGSPRNTHLHVQSGSIDRIKHKLSQKLDAVIYSRRDALDAELFGTRELSDVAKRRIGDLVISHKTHGVWYGSEKEELKQVGMHGGLRPNEMLIPFATINLSDY